MAKKRFNLKAKHKSKKGGLTAEGRRAYNQATGSNLKRPQPEGGSRKKSYCARSKGQMNDHNIDCSKTPDKRICLARRRWKCNKSLQKSDMPPKAKLAAFLREHLDNKLALKEAEPTITKSNELVGGKGDTKDIADFDPKQVQMGLKVELEHTDNLEVAKEIVADHLSEDPFYYSKLKGSGLADELKKAGRCWEGYEPTPGKKPYSKGSCRKIKKSLKQKLIKALACKGEKLNKSISAMAIESGEYQGEPLDSHHHNRIGQEYRGMAKQAFTEGKKAKAREYHEKALKHFQMADKMGFQQEEPLEKKISDKLRTLGIGAAITAGSIATPNQTSMFADKPPATEKKLEAPPVAPEKITKLSQLSAGNPLHMFLWNIAQKESSGGENTNHPTITDPKSMHYGMRAIGNFALMPLTVQEFTNRYKRNGGKDPRILKILKMNAPSGEINTYLEKNPDIEFELAGNAANHVLKTHGYTPEAAYAWKYGHNKTAQSVKSPESQAKMKSDSYVSDFKQLLEGGSPKGLTPATKMPKPNIK